VTDSSDEGNAAQLGVNFASKLRFASHSMNSSSPTSAEQVMVVDNNMVSRSGMVDFNPVRKLVPGSPEPFPPAVNQPGSVRDANYSSLIQLMNAGGHVWNAPIIAGNVTDKYLNQFCNGILVNMTDDFYSKVHGRVLAICPRTSMVTLETIHGFSFSKSVL
jgi:hypothetical protein